MRRLALAALLCGCAEAQESGEVRLEVGTGVERFAPIVPGSEVEVHCGVQGGQHVWTSVRATGLSATVADVRFTLRDTATWKIACNQELPEVPLQSSGEGRELLGVACFVSDPQSITGRPAVLEATLDDHRGHPLTAKVSFVPVWHGPCRGPVVLPDAGFEVLDGGSDPADAGAP